MMKIKYFLMSLITVSMLGMFDLQGKGSQVTIMPKKQCKRTLDKEKILSGAIMISAGIGCAFTAAMSFISKQ